jgi:hypothetical protein
MRLVLFALMTAFAQPVAASDAVEEYVQGNVLATLYHEIGHAMIDVLELPVLGQEEDAADTLAVVLTHNLWEEAEARSVATATAMSFYLAAGESDEPSYWDVHGPDEQRFFNTVCLFYGADPDARADFAEENELPPERAEYCADEFSLADESWRGLLADTELGEGDDPAASFAFEDPEDGSDLATLLADEVTDLNARFALPVTVAVRLGPCGEANAFYDPADQSILICTEYVDYLTQQAAEADL